MNIGDLLKNKRLEIGVDINDISNELHIKVDYLQAIESQDFDCIPSRTQARGFVSMYTDYLGLDKQDILKSFDQYFTNINEEIQKPIKTNIITKVEKSLIKKQHHEIQASDHDENEIKQSEIIFKELGEEIKNHRNKLGLSIEDVERFTFVKKDYLIALEEGHIKYLPSTVQAKGILQNYLSFLEMEKDLMLLKFAEGLQAQLKEKRPTQDISNRLQSKRSSNISFWKKLLTPDMIVGTAIIFFLLVFGIWSVSKIVTLRNEELEAYNPSISDALLNQPTAIITPITGIENEQSSFINLAENDQQNSNADTEDSAPTITLPVFDNSPIQLYIVSQQRTWLKIVSDNVEVFNGRVVPGTAYPFSGKNKIELSTGNAAALQIYFNEEEIGNLGEVGQVINFLFTLEGITTPTPKYSPTPSPTVEITATVPIDTSTPTPTVTPFIP